MRKLTLDLEAVQVESFTTQAAAPARGTVDARQGRETWTCPPATQNTCVGTCGCQPTGYTDCGTCDLSCNGTCFDLTCDTCQLTCNVATGPERCCAV
jgi:hypothetical protein